MASPASSSIDAFTALDEGQQRAALASMSPEAKTALLGALQSKQPAVPSGPQPDVAAAIAHDVPRPAVPSALAPPTFSERIGERIKENAYAIPEALDALSRKVKGQETPEDKAKSEYFENLVGKKDYQSGTVPGVATGVAKSVLVVPRMIYDMGKSWTQDPANAVGDVIAGYVGHQMSAGGKPTEEPVPSKMSSTRQPLTAEQQAKYTADLDKANAEHTQALADYADQESTARAKWVQKAFKAKQSVVDAVKATNHKEVLDRGAQEYTRVAKDNIQATHDAVRSGLDQRWNSLRDGMDGVEIPAADLFNAVEKAKTEFLRGSPASVQQFNNLVKELGIQNVVEGEGGGFTAAPGPEAIPWETARVHSSAIGQRLASGNLPGNVYQALKAVRTSLEDSLGKAAEVRGRGTEYNAVRKDWSNYMTDWQDTSGVNKGGSPLAHALQSPDAPTVAKIINGPAGDRMISTLAKYKNAGARPDLLASARTISQAADNIKVPNIKTPPSPYEAPTQPELPTVKTPKASDAKAGPIARTVGRLTGKVAGGTVGHAMGHPLLGYGLGGELGQQMADRLAGGATEAVPPKLKGPGLISKAARRATAGAPAAAGVVGLRTLRGGDPDSQAINDANEDIQKFIDSLPK